MKNYPEITWLLSTFVINEEPIKPTKNSFIIKYCYYYISSKSFAITIVNCIICLVRTNSKGSNSNGGAGFVNLAYSGAVT